MKRKPLLFGLLTITVIVVTFMLKRIPQSAAYHDFADKRLLLGIPNFWNVVTNIPFLITVIIGLSLLNKHAAGKRTRTIYAFLFTGIFLTGLGSGYYHFSPDNDSLVFDRIPMTIVFMSLTAATVAEAIDIKTGYLLLFPLLIIGTGSVLLWHFTEVKGDGDLRLYGLVQFYPMLLIPLILFLYPGQTNSGLRQLVMVVVWYIVAKLCELSDKQIYSAGNFISGHSLKHLTAAVSTWYLVALFMKKHSKSLSQK
ncbi:MAG: ceramidase domain-containing protein [Ferruginibacter sp.]